MTSVTAATSLLGATPETAKKSGEANVRYGLVIVIAWFAFMHSPWSKLKEYNLW